MSLARNIHSGTFEEGIWRVIWEHRGVNAKSFRHIDTEYVGEQIAKTLNWTVTQGNDTYENLSRDLEYKNLSQIVSDMWLWPILPHKASNDVSHKITNIWDTASEQRTTIEKYEWGISDTTLLHDESRNILWADILEYLCNKFPNRDTKYINIIHEWITYYLDNSVARNAKERLQAIKWADQALALESSQIESLSNAENLMKEILEELPANQGLDQITLDIKDEEQLFKKIQEENPWFDEDIMQQIIIKYLKRKINNSRRVIIENDNPNLSNPKGQFTIVWKDYKGK